jgi:ribosomal protein S12
MEQRKKLKLKLKLRRKHETEQMESFLSSLKQSLSEKELQIKIIDDTAKMPARAYSASLLPKRRIICQELFQNEQQKSNTAIRLCCSSNSKIMNPVLCYSSDAHMPCEVLRFGSNSNSSQRDMKRMSTKNDMENE